jgi:hypothetical protein
LYANQWIVANRLRHPKVNEQTVRRLAPSEATRPDRISDVERLRGIRKPQRQGRGGGKGNRASRALRTGELDREPAFQRVTAMRFQRGFRYWPVHWALTCLGIACAHGTESLDHSRSNGAEARR